MAQILKDIGFGLWIGLTIYLLNHQMPGPPDVLTALIGLGAAALYVIAVSARRRNQAGLHQGRSSKQHARHNAER